MVRRQSDSKRKKHTSLRRVSKRSKRSSLRRRVPKRTKRRYRASDQLEALDLEEKQLEEDIEELEKEKRPLQDEYDQLFPAAFHGDEDFKAHLKHIGEQLLEIMEKIKFKRNEIRSLQRKKIEISKRIIDIGNNSNQS